MDARIAQIKKRGWEQAHVAQDYLQRVNTPSTLQYFLASRFTDHVTSQYPDPASTRVLDLGCGTGILFQRLAALGYNVDGLDVSTEMLAQINTAGLDPNRCRLLVGDVFSLDLPPESYDAVVSRWLLPHFPNWRQILPEVYRVLVKGGSFSFDITSKDTYLTALRTTTFAYDNFFYDDRASANPSKYYAASTQDELLAAALESGFTLSPPSIKPLSFFHANPLLCGGPAPRLASQEYVSLLNAVYGTTAGKQLLEYFEAVVTPTLPPEMCNSWLVTLTKPTDG